ncbi:hypothetical protein F511_39929 [Dorcoceras hygrometricum]|uniref:Uncharacterized protein n=1 Tax=Dorcoceras hygrometricum TaxID=472368 RepID=A0A2Z7B2K1_9LAMI|nr:hypothetical protein F511_39929 [Dorcoceras hygrometricum]
MTGAPPAGPPPGPFGSNDTNHGPNRGSQCAREGHEDGCSPCARTRREIGAQSALDHQASLMDDKFQNFELWGGGGWLLHQKGG